MKDRFTLFVAFLTITAALSFTAHSYPARIKKFYTRTSEHPTFYLTQISVDLCGISPIKFIYGFAQKKGDTYLPLNSCQAKIVDQNMIIYLLPETVNYQDTKNVFGVWACSPIYDKTVWTREWNPPQMIFMLTGIAAFIIDNPRITPAETIYSPECWEIRFRPYWL